MSHVVSSHTIQRLVVEDGCVRIPKNLFSSSAQGQIDIFLRRRKEFNHEEIFVLIKCFACSNILIYYRSYSRLTYLTVAPQFRLGFALQI